MKTILPILFALICSTTYSQNEIISLYNDLTPLGAKLRTADFNSDGVPDFVFMNEAGLTVVSGDSYIENSWDPIYQGPFNTAGPLNLNIGDLDSDGDMDIFYGGNNGYYLYFNDGNANFEELVLPEISLYLAREMGIGDVDNDGDNDLSLGLNSDVIWVENIDSWSDYEYHTVTDGALGLRGSIMLDWNVDGKMDIVTLPGGLGLPLVVYLQGDEMWEEVTITGTNGGTYSIDTADVDNDGDIDVGIGCNGTVEFIDTGSGEVTSLSYANGLPDGGQFADIDNDGTLEWVQVGWSGGMIACVDIVDGVYSEVCETGIVIPDAHDMKVMDADNNGTLDIIFSTYFGDQALAVVPDFVIELDCHGTVSVGEEENSLSLFYANQMLTVRSQNQVKSIQIFDSAGRLVKDILSPSQSQFDLFDLSAGVYIARVLTTEGWESERFVVSH